VANLQRDIVQLIEFLNESSQNRATNKISRAQNLVISQMKETLDAMNLKPEKGRRKDLRRIERAVRAMKKIAFSDRKDA
jgi:hypothetical protein